MDLSNQELKLSKKLAIKARKSSTKNMVLMLSIHLQDNNRKRRKKNPKLLNQGKAQQLQQHKSSTVRYV